MAIDKDLVKELYQQGHGYTKIGEMVGVSKQRVHQIIKKYGNTGKKKREDKYIGFDLCSECSEPAEVLHHIDFDNSNDKKENLQKLCNKCHHKKHKGRPQEGALKRSDMNISRTTFIVDKDKYKALKVKLYAEGRSVSEWLRDAMDDVINMG